MRACIHVAIDYIIHGSGLIDIQDHDVMLLVLEPGIIAFSEGEYRHERARILVIFIEIAIAYESNQITRLIGQIVYITIGQAQGEDSICDLQLFRI